MNNERKVLKSVGRAEHLPAVFNINSVPTTASLTDKKFKQDTGTYHNNMLSHVIEFPDTGDVGYQSDVSEIKKKINKQLTLRFTQKELLDKFYIYSIPDYGHQTMTANNFDVVLKIFSENLKIHPSNMFYIRSYTTKEIYIAITKKIGNIQNILVVVDFNTKQVRDIENTTLLNNSEIKTKYEHYLNNQDLKKSYIIGENSSPYLDHILYSENTPINNMYLDKQGNYFGYLMDADSKSRESSIILNLEDPDLFKHTGKVIKKIAGSSDGADIANFSSKCIHNIDNRNDVKKYLDNLNYEVYYYITSDISSKPLLHGKRLLTEIQLNSIIADHIIFEIYPKGSNLIHYIFELGNDVNKIETIHELMKYQGIYLFDKDFDNSVIYINNGEILTEIVSDNINYVEIYLSLPEYYDYDKVEVKELEPEEATEIETLKDIALHTFTSTIKNKSSQFDPSVLSNQNIFENTENFYVPYNIYDNSIKPIIQENEITFSVYNVYNINENMYEYANQSENPYENYTTISELEPNKNIIEFFEYDKNKENILSEFTVEKEENLKAYRTSSDILNKLQGYTDAEKSIITNLLKIAPDSKSFTNLGQTQSSKKISVNDCALVIFEPEPGSPTAELISATLTDSNDISIKIYLECDNGKYYYLPTKPWESITPELNGKYYKLR